MRNRGFTVLQTTAALAIVAIALVLILVSLGQPRGKGSRFMANNTQLRGIHQGMVTFAQSNKIGGNDGYFPGLDASGDVIPDGEATGYSGDGTHPGAQLWMMLEGNFFTPDYILNPADTAVTEYPTPAAADPANPLTPQHFSYAHLGLADLADGGETGGDQRGIEWKETLNTAAIVLGDRAIGTGRTNITSVWTLTTPGDWHGGVTRNDNSTSFETTAKFEHTKYGNADANDLDHLFEDAPNASDTFLIHANPTTAYNPR